MNRTLRENAGALTGPHRQERRRLAQAIWPMPSMCWAGSRGSLGERRHPGVAADWDRPVVCPCGPSRRRSMADALATWRRLGTARRPAAGRPARHSVRPATGRCCHRARWWGRPGSRPASPTLLPGRPLRRASQLEPTLAGARCPGVRAATRRSCIPQPARPSSRGSADWRNRATGGQLEVRPRSAPDSDSSGCRSGGVCACCRHETGRRRRSGASASGRPSRRHSLRAHVLTRRARVTALEIEGVTPRCVIGRATLGAAKLATSQLSCANSKYGRVAQW
jgi:hypothetical protein